MNANEAARLAAAVNLLRPDWPADSLRTFVARNLADRPYRDAAVALAWVACEPESQTPARVLGAGPWWKVGADAQEPERAKLHIICGQFHRTSDPCTGPVVITGRLAEHVQAARQATRAKPPEGAERG